MWFLRDYLSGAPAGPARVSAALLFVVGTVVVVAALLPPSNAGKIGTASLGIVGVVGALLVLPAGGSSVAHTQSAVPCGFTGVRPAHLVDEADAASSPVRATWAGYSLAFAHEDGLFSQLYLTVTTKIEPPAEADETLFLMATGDPNTHDSTNEHHPGGRNIGVFGPGPIHPQPSGCLELNNIAYGYSQYCGITGRILLARTNNKTAVQIMKEYKTPTILHNGFTPEELENRVSFLQSFAVPTAGICESPPSGAPATTS